MVPVYAPEDILAGKKNPRKIGMMSDPDAPGAVILDRAAWEYLFGKTPSVSGRNFSNAWEQTGIGPDKESRDGEESAREFFGA